jgi:hypothetical protein
MELEQNENFLSSDFVNQDYEQNFNQGTMKRYVDIQDNIPQNTIMRKQINSSYNYTNSINNIPQNKIQISTNKDIQNQIKENKNPFLDKEIIPERSLSHFYGTQFLTDAILKVDEYEIPFHKVVCCAASDFLYKYFNLNPNLQENQKPVVIVPEIMKSSYSRGNKKECLEKILKYCYYNQDIKSIESDITINNCFTLLELSHCLGIKSLNQNLEKLIIKHFLKDDNMIKLSEESNNFELPELHKECSNKIKKCIGNVTNKAKELTELKYDTFKDIVSADELDVEGEKEVAELVLEYIKSRREIPEEVPLNPPQEQDKQNNEVKENNENNENKENNENQENEENKNNEEPPQNQENQENQEQNNDNENAQNQNQENNNPSPDTGDGTEIQYKEWKKHLLEIEKISKKKRLTPEEEKTLIYCIRFSFLSHSDLISLTNEPIMKDYKDLILQGLSARLNTYENTSEPRHLINLKPRTYLRGQQASNQNNTNNLPRMDNSGDMNPNYNKNQMLRSVGNLGDQNQYMRRYNDPRNFAQSQNINMNNNYSESPSYYDDNNNSNYGRSDVMNIDDINNKKKKLAMMIKSSSTPYPPQDPRISEEFFRNQLIMSVPKPIFKYTYDFDENGALYFLGTKGKRHQYRNPHEINMVKAFASSVSKGEVSDFVGRNLVNLRTENEENSFFGVDLGNNRTLVPTAYSLRNRNSSSHVMLCWNLEASNDRINFEILDTRIFSNSNNPKIHQKLEKERNLLKEPGCTSTWGISKKIREKFPDGFRYFLLKQIDKNSNGSYNLAISGFELYGEGKGRGWIFN